MYINDELINRVDSTMYSLVNNIIKIDIEEIEDYDFPLDQAFGLQIIHHDELYCFIIRFSSQNKNFICMGPGAHARDEKDSKGNIIYPPFFVRWRWYKYLEESTIAYADPVMFHQDDINITWFAGNKNHWPLEDLASIIEKLARNQGVLNDNILCFGSSGGGFSSIMLATLIKNSKVLVNNPQVFALNYTKRPVEKLLDLLDEEFEYSSREELINSIKYRLDAIELFKRENYAPFITYYVNIKSKNDINRQALPFIDQYQNIEQNNTLNMVFYDGSSLEKAHDPIPTPETIEIIKDFCEDFLNNDDEHFKNNGTDIIEKGKHVSKLKDEIVELEEENARLIKLYNGADLTSESKIDYLRNTNNQLKNEIEGKKDSLKKKNREIKRLKKQNKNFKSSKAYKVWQSYSKIKKIF